MIDPRIKPQWTGPSVLIPFAHHGTLLLRVLRHGVFALLLVSAATKLYDPKAFFADLGTWYLVPSWSRGALAIAIPYIELLIAGSWFLGVSRYISWIAAFSLLAMYSVVYSMHVALVDPPRCGCFWVLDNGRSESESTATWWLIVRNAIMMTILLCSEALSPAKRPSRDSAARPVQPCVAGSAAPGFTLVELLLVLGIVGIVLALTVPKLGAARARTQEIKSIANLRTHAQTLTVYAGDNEEVPPYITDPAASWTVIRGGGVSVVVDYFGLFCTWNVALADAYFGGEVLNDALVVPWMQAQFLAVHPLLLLRELHLPARLLELRHTPRGQKPVEVHPSQRALVPEHEGHRPGERSHRRIGLGHRTPRADHPQVRARGWSRPGLPRL